jgi:hypothetical protein
MTFTRWTRSHLRTKPEPAQPLLASPRTSVPTSFEFAQSDVLPQKTGVRGRAMPRVLLFLLTPDDSSWHSRSRDASSHAPQAGEAAGAPAASPGPCFPTWALT